MDLYEESLVELNQNLVDLSPKTFILYEISSGSQQGMKMEGAGYL